MELVITDTAKDDIRYFVKSGQLKIVKKIEELLVSIKQDPFSGIGKPEPLRYNFAGKWSRLINSEHRIIYGVDEEIIYIYSAKGHYQ